MLKTVTLTEEILECDKHGRLPHGDKTCPWCDLCEHGKMRTQQCLEGKCGNMEWRKPDISKEEFERIKRYAAGHKIGTRNSPHPRQFMGVDLLPLLLAEYEALKFGTPNDRTM